MSDDTEMSGYDGADGGGIGGRMVHRAGCRSGGTRPCERGLGGDILCRTHSHCGSFQQGIAGQPVGAVKPRAGGLAGDPQARHRTSASAVRGNAAHMIVHGRADGDQFTGRIYSSLPAEQVDCRKPGGKAGAKGLAGVKKHPAAAQDFTIYRACDDVAGGEFRAGNRGHEPFTAFVEEKCAFAPHCLANQRQRPPR